jgi:uncharacterized protein (TIGR00297 family)
MHQLAPAVTQSESTSDGGHNDPNPIRSSICFGAGLFANEIVMRIIAVSELRPSAVALAGIFPASSLSAGLLVTLAFTAIARLLRGVSRSGAVAGAAICFVLYAGAGPGAFAALVSLFVLTWASTRLGYQRKRKLGIAEKRDGRTAWQVLANLAVAAICAGFSAAIAEKALLLLAASAALSEAAADTVSSELGQARSERARLVTTWEAVPAGTDGGISWTGTLAGIAAASAVSLVCVVVGLMPFRWLGISVSAAILGMLADSFLGALLERRKLLNNNAVNFLGTAIAAITAFLAARYY